METHVLFTTALHRSKNMSVETAEPVGTEESNTSSSSNTEIPKWCKQIIENKSDKFFVCYYLTEHEQILGERSWLFEGRDKIYEGRTIAQCSGRCTNIFVTFEGKVKHINPFLILPGVYAYAGESVLVKMKGEFIP